MSSLSRRALCLGMGLLLLTGLGRADPLRIGSWNRKTDSLVRVSEAVLTQAYAELHQPVEFVELPVRRAMQMMLSRELDGNVYRVADVALSQPALYRVATPIGDAEVRAYAIDSNLKTVSWSDLAGLRVAYMRGTLLVEKNLPAGSRPIEASSQAEMFRMVKRGMTDVLLFVEPAQAEPNPLATDAGVRRLESALERLPVFHYLSGRHQELGKRLDAVLSRMEASGESQAIRIKTLDLMNQD
ncbi:substrate-binding periplasmic protein [Roseateles oligotrophus]|uniref:Transporter substrate-binding domain-containing protein n=1 Tax=Roseateles oligotrophus TaxID=1769250 RepID=A0ABT2YBE6_9BURK|nr:transporter substrate-binding domain-containing protein [Roseateles oligotrophus]MCV2367474.1 transporter substrate-binding domain-containing protein [Roseateles oligotrophus]